MIDLNRLLILLGRIWAVAITIMILFYTFTAFIIGGDAFQGKIDGNRYFVAHNKGGEQHQVSYLIFLISLWQLRVLLGLAVVGVVLALSRRLLISKQKPF